MAPPALQPVTVRVGEESRVVLLIGGHRGSESRLASSGVAQGRGDSVRQTARCPAPPLWLCPLPPSFQAVSLCPPPTPASASRWGASGASGGRFPPRRRFRGDCGASALPGSRRSNYRGRARPANALSNRSRRWREICCELKCGKVKESPVHPAAPRPLPPLGTRRWRKIKRPTTATMQ